MGKNHKFSPKNMISEKCEALKILKMALKIRKTENSGIEVGRRPGHAALDLLISASLRISKPSARSERAESRRSLHNSLMASVDH